MADYKPFKHSEKQLQRSIVEILELHDWYVCEYGKPGGHAALRGAVPEGHSDLLVLKRLPTGPVAWFIEVKVPGKKPTPEQWAFMDRMIQAGAKANVITCIEDLLVVLRSWGQEVKVEVR